MVTIKEKYESLTKRQKKAIDFEEYSCKDDFDSHIEMMYDFNQLPLSERRKMIKETKKFIR